MKKIFACFLSIIICMGIYVNINIPAKSYCGHTQAEAIDWVQNQVGKSIDYDGAYGVQCVDLAKAYYAYLGVDAVSGNGSDYTYNTLPSGWTRIQGAQPQTGDI